MARTLLIGSLLVLFSTLVLTNEINNNIEEEADPRTFFVVDLGSSTSDSETVTSSTALNTTLLGYALLGVILFGTIAALVAYYATSIGGTTTDSFFGRYAVS